MARKPRFAPPNYPLHVTQRGNYRQPVFFTDADRNQFLKLLSDHADDRRVLVHGHTLMSNHIHLVVTGREEGGVSRLMQQVTGQYAQYLHGRLNRRGRLWQSRFYSCVLDAHHFLTALAYVDLNAVRAGIVSQATDYVWSSAAAHCGLSAAPPDWLDLEALHRRVSPLVWRERLEAQQPRHEVAALRRATRAEYPLGGPGFVEELEAKFQIRLRPLPPGPPAKKPSQSHEVEREVSRRVGQSG